MNGERFSPFQKHWRRIVSVNSIKEIMGCGMAKLSRDDYNVTKSTIATQDGKSIESNNREVNNDHLEIYKREVF